MALDNAKNFAKVTLSTGYNNAATSVVLATGDGAKLPTVPFNVVWWDASLYADPADDPNVEIVRVTNIAVDTLTITRAQEGTSAANHNVSGHTYKMLAGLTAKVINTDVNLSSTVNLTLANGANNNVAIPNGTNGQPAKLLRIIGVTGSFNITGFAGGVDGQSLTIFNTSANNMTINNQNAGSSASNQIFTFKAADVAIGAGHGGIANFVYDGTDSNWLLTSWQAA